MLGKATSDREDEPEEDVIESALWSYGSKSRLLVCEQSPYVGASISSLFRKVLTELNELSKDDLPNISPKLDPEVEEKILRGIVTNLRCYTTADSPLWPIDEALTLQPSSFKEGFKKATVALTARLDQDGPVKKLIKELFQRFRRREIEDMSFKLEGEPSIRLSMKTQRRYVYYDDDGNPSNRRKQILSRLDEFAREG